MGSGAGAGSIGRSTTGSDMCGFGAEMIGSMVTGAEMIGSVGAGADGRRIAASNSVDS